MKRLFITLFVLTLLTGKGWSEDSKEILAEESNTAWFDSILSWLENSDMTSLKKYCEGDSRKMIDVLYYYVPYLNKPQKRYGIMNTNVKDRLLVSQLNMKMQ